MYREKNQNAVFQEELLIPSDQYDPRALPEFMESECFEIQFKKKGNYPLGNLNYRNNTFSAKFNICVQVWLGAMSLLS